MGYLKGNKAKIVLGKFGVFSIDSRKKEIYTLDKKTGELKITPFKDFYKLKGN
jgi:hypothetical protein